MTVAGHRTSNSLSLGMPQVGAASALRAAPRVALGCAAGDAALGGGLFGGGVTEVCGPAGSGKTQLALRAALCALRAPGGGAARGRSVYICTEGRAPTARLRDIALRGGCGCQQKEANVAGGGAPPAELLDRVLVREVHDSEQLLHAVARELPVLLRRGSRDEDSVVRLVIIDSLAAVARAGFEVHDGALAALRARAQWLDALAAAMHAMQAAFGCAFLVINQVTSGKDDTRAALGLGWSNWVNSRVMLSCRDQDRDHDQDARGSGGRGGGVRLLPLRRRALEVKFSPVHADVRIEYVVRPGGICCGGKDW